MSGAFEMNSKKAYFYILLAVFFWSTVATAFKVSLKYLTVVQFLFVSSLTSTIVLLVLSTGNFSFDRKGIVRSALLGALNPFAYYFVLFGAYSLLPAQIAQPINYTWPVILTVFSVAFLKQKATLLNYAGILISFSGAALITFAGHSAFPKEVNLYGVLLAFLSAFVWAIFWTLNLKDERPESVKLFFDFLFGTIYISAVFLFTRSFTHINPKGILPAVYVGVFEMGITYLLFIKAIKISNSSAKISNFAYLSPFLSLIFISTVLREKILFSTIIGLFLIVSGIIIGNSARN